MKDMLPLLMAMNGGNGKNDVSALMPMLAAMNGGGGDSESIMKMMSMMIGGNNADAAAGGAASDSNAAMLAMLMSMMNNNKADGDKAVTKEREADAALKETDFNFDYYNKIKNKK